MKHRSAKVAVNRRAKAYIRAAPVWRDRIALYPGRGRRRLWQTRPAHGVVVGRNVEWRLCRLRPDFLLHLHADVPVERPDRPPVEDRGIVGGRRRGELRERQVALSAEIAARRAIVHGRVRDEAVHEYFPRSDGDSFSDCGAGHRHPNDIGWAVENQSLANGDC